MAFSKNYEVAQVSRIIAIENKKIAKTIFSLYLYSKFSILDIISFCPLFVRFLANIFRIFFCTTRLQNFTQRG